MEDLTKMYATPGNIMEEWDMVRLYRIYKIDKLKEKIKEKIDECKEDE